METKMISSSKSWGRIAAVAGVTFLAACGMENRQMVSTPPPPPPASAHASVYQVAFAPGSYEINLAGQRAKTCPASWTATSAPW
jgi:hypothetical protein